MATRNLTGKFENLRQSAKRKSRARADFHDTDSPSLGADDSGNRTLLEPGQKGMSDSAADVRAGLEHALPPEWVEIVETIQKDVKSIRDNLGHLEKLHDLRLKVSFDKDESEQERDIEVLTQAITMTLKKCEGNLKRIATIGNAKGTNLPQQERVVRLNVMRNLGAELHTLSQVFRKSQKTFLGRLRGQDEIGNDVFKGDDSKNPITMDEALDRGLTDAQMQVLREQERQADDRQKEIIHIAQSINELAQIFRELSVLVIEQGTILDRIDYNIEQTLVKVDAGVVELEKANEYSKKARTIKCILVLLLLVIILVIVIVVKKTDFHKSSSSDDGK